MDNIKRFANENPGYKILWTNDIEEDQIIFRMEYENCYFEQPISPSLYFSLDVSNFLQKGKEEILRLLKEES